MNLNILYNLWRIKKSASPSREFKRELWRELERSFSFKPQISYRQIWFRWSMVGVVSLLIVASLSTGVYAYNSPDVTENTPLYPVKQALENVEAVTKVAPEAKAQFLVKTIARREAEKQVMQKRGQAVEKIEKRIDKTAEQLQKTDETLQKMEVKKELKNKEIRPQIQAVLEKRLENKKVQIEKQQERIENRQKNVEDQPRTTKGAGQEPRTTLGTGKNQDLNNKINKQVNSDKKDKSRNGHNN